MIAGIKHGGLGDHVLAAVPQSERGIVACGDKEVTAVAGGRAGRHAGFPRPALAVETWLQAVQAGKLVLGGEMDAIVRGQSQPRE